MTAVDDEGVAGKAWGCTRSMCASCKKGCSDWGEGEGEGELRGCWYGCLSECSGFSGEYEYGSGDQAWIGMDVEGDCTASRGMRPWSGRRSGKRAAGGEYGA